jgi:hypothetical protein
MDRGLIVLVSSDGHLAQALQDVGYQVLVSKDHTRALSLASSSTVYVAAAITEEDGLELLDELARQAPSVMRVLLVDRAASGGGVAHHALPRADVALALSELLSPG